MITVITFGRSRLILNVDALIVECVVYM